MTGTWVEIPMPWRLVVVGDRVAVHGTVADDGFEVADIRRWTHGRLKVTQLGGELYQPISPVDPDEVVTVLVLEHMADAVELVMNDLGGVVISRT